MRIAKINILPFAIGFFCAFMVIDYYLRSWPFVLRHAQLGGTRDELVRFVLMSAGAFILWWVLVSLFRLLKVRLIVTLRQRTPPSA